MSTLTDQDITNALLAGNGLLNDAARHLSEHLGKPVSRAMVASRVEGSRVLRAVQQIAQDRSFERSLAAAQERRTERRSASMKASWAESPQAQTDSANDMEHVHATDEPNARACARASRTITKATVQAARERRLCCARTRKGFPCVRRVVPGKNRCPNHGGLSSGPKTAAGKARIAAAQRARWARYRQERARRRSASSGVVQ
jgi:hypothetical protein